MAAGHEPDAFHHVKDTTDWTFFDHLTGPIHLKGLSIDLNFIGIDHTFYVTKFMILQLIAAGLILAIYIPIARRFRSGHLPKGGFWNGFEILLTFIRTDVAKPTLGAKDADKYVPFLWTLFLFILFNNLLGMIPFMGSATASIGVTGALALCAFVMMHGAPIREKGLFKYLKSHWLHIEVPYVGFIFSLMIYIIEMLGTMIKSFVLAVRLFANMFAGHLVLAVILIFIYQTGKEGLTTTWGVVTFASVLGVTALSLLELFVAFLQAYIFVFLTSLFLGMSLHPEH